MKFIKIKSDKFDFEMQSTPVTQALWVQIMGTNPAYFKGDDHGQLK